MNRFDRFRTSAYLLGIAIGLVGIALFVATAYLTGVPQVIFSTIAGALITVSLFNVIYDAVTRPRLIRDIQDASGLPINSVTKIAELSELLPSLDGYIPTQTDFVVMVASINEFLNQSTWRAMRGHACKKRITLTIYCEKVAGKKEKLELNKRLKADWERKSGKHSAMSNGSVINVHSCELTTQVSVYKTSGRAIIAFDAPFLEFIPGEAIGIVVEGHDSPVWDWLRETESRVAASTVETLQITGKWTATADQRPSAELDESKSEDHEQPELNEADS